VRDHEMHYQVAKALFKEVSTGKARVEILDIIIAEVIYVLHSFYKHTKKEIVETLKDLFSQEHITIYNKAIIFEAMDIFERKNIDFADAILCAKQHLEGYEVMSFDKDIKKCGQMK
jgi:predicted nucleic-acid-binding protein